MNAEPAAGAACGPPLAEGWEYLDVSGDPSAERRIIVNPQLRAGLEQLGFERLGFACGRHPGRKDDLISEVWCSPDRLTHAELTHNESMDDFELTSLFDDGTVWKTAMRMPSPMRLLWGPLVEHHPSDRFFIEARSGTVGDLYAAHARELERLTAELGAPVAVTDLGAHFAARLRGNQLSLSRVNQSNRIVWRVTSAVVVVLPVLAYLAWPGTLWVKGIAATLALVAAVALAPLLTLLMIPRIAPKMAGPAPLPAKELLAWATRVPKGMLRSEG